MTVDVVTFSAPTIPFNASMILGSRSFGLSPILLFPFLWLLINSASTLLLTPSSLQSSDSRWLFIVRVCECCHLQAPWGIVHGKQRQLWPTGHFRHIHRWINFLLIKEHFLFLETNCQAFFASKAENDQIKIETCFGSFDLD